MRKTFYLFVTLLVVSVTTHAAYPLDEITVVASAKTTATTSTVSNTTSSKKVLKKELAAAASANAGGKSKIVAALLAFFIGTFGIHSFYMGQKKKGFIQLGLTLLGTVLIIVGLASTVAATTTTTATIAGTAIAGYVLLLGVGLWAFIDFIRILTGGLAPEEGFSD